MTSKTNKPSDAQILEVGQLSLDAALVDYVEGNGTMQVLSDLDGRRFACFCVEGRVALVVPAPFEAPTVLQ